MLPSVLLTGHGEQEAGSAYISLKRRGMNKAIVLQVTTLYTHQTKHVAQKLDQQPLDASRVTCCQDWKAFSVKCYVPCKRVRDRCHEGLLRSAFDPMAASVCKSCALATKVPRALSLITVVIKSLCGQFCLAFSSG